MSAWKNGPLTGVAVSIIALCSYEQSAAGIDAGGVLGTYTGSISALGDLHVNGMRFNTDSARFVVDGQTGSNLDLEVGKVVTVYGRSDDYSNTGTAFVVVYDSLVDGPIDAIDTAAGRITVLGQPVIITAETHFEPGGGPATLSSLQPGTHVEVSGYPNAEGGIVATFIGASTSPGFASVTGTVMSSDPGAMMLEINDLQIDYNQAGLFDVANTTADVGQRLQISGALDPITGRLIARQVALAPNGIDAGGMSYEIDGIDAGGIGWEIDGIDAGGIGWEIDGIDAGGMGWEIDGIDAGGMAAEIEGYVESAPTLQTLRVNGTDIQIGSRTRFVNGQPGKLGPNQKVDIRGTVTGDGVVIADSIEFERGVEEQRTGYVEAIRGDELTVANETARLTSETAYSDQRDTVIREFAAESLYVGDAVVLHGYASADGFIVTRLDRLNSLALHGDHYEIGRSAAGADVD